MLNWGKMEWEKMVLFRPRDNGFSRFSWLSRIALKCIYRLWVHIHKHVMYILLCQQTASPSLTVYISMPTIHFLPFLGRKCVYTTVASSKKNRPYFLLLKCMIHPPLLYVPSMPFQVIVRKRCIFGPLTSLYLLSLAIITLRSADIVQQRRLALQ